MRCTYNVMLKRFLESVLPWNYIFCVCVCVFARAQVLVCVFVYVCVCVWVGDRERTCACACVALLIQHTTRLYIAVSGLWLHYIFGHSAYLINSTTFGKKIY